MKTSFRRKIISRLPVEELWQQIKVAIKDSTGHPFWPTNLEQSNSRRLRASGLISVHYKGLLALQPVQYRITNLSNEQHTLHYETTEQHPLDGGATIRVRSNSKGGSELQWEGVYSYPWYHPARLFLPYFLNRFFSCLRENLHDYEEEKEYQINFAKVHKLDERRVQKLAANR